MIALALLAQTVEPPPTPPVSVAEDIIVIGRLVQQVQMILGRDPQGRVTCSLTRSSGNARVDAAVCRRVSRCLSRRPLSAERMDSCIADARLAVVREWGRAQ